MISCWADVLWVIPQAARANRYRLWSWIWPIPSILWCSLGICVGTHSVYFVYTTTLWCDWPPFSSTSYVRWWHWTVQVWNTENTESVLTTMQNCVSGVKQWTTVHNKLQLNEGKTEALLYWSFQIPKPSWVSNDWADPRGLATSVQYHITKPDATSGIQLAYRPVYLALSPLDTSSLSGDCYAQSPMEVSNSGEDGREYIVRHGKYAN